MITFKKVVLRVHHRVHHLRLKTTRVELGIVGLPGADCKKVKEAQRKEAEGEFSCPTSTEVGKRANGERAKKRPKLDHVTPSPSYSHLDKKLKIVEHRSYTQATKNFVRMALILEGYSDVKLDASKLSLIRKALREKMLGLLKDTRHPKFEGISIKDYAAVVNC